MHQSHEHHDINYWELRDYWNLGARWQDRVCHGYRRAETKDHYGFHLSRGVPVCDTCGRPPFWLIFVCVDCGELFIKDFADPRFCPLDARCWSCIQHSPYDYCADHILPIYRNNLDLFPSHPPVGLNPRKFTEEELDPANVFGIDF